MGSVIWLIAKQWKKGLQNLSSFGKIMVFTKEVV
jgi:hypothetical protein